MALRLRGTRRTARIAASLLTLGLLAAGAGPAAAAPTAAERSAAREALQRVEQARDGELPGRDVTIANRDLAAAADDLSTDDRARAARLLARPSPTTGSDGFLSYAGRVEESACSTRFCVHWVTTGDDAPDLTDRLDRSGAAGANQVPDYVDSMLREFEFVATRQNTELAWPSPISDGGRGGDSRFDVYLGNLGAKMVYGYAASEGSGSRRAAYMAMDDDYVEYGPTTPTVALQVTAAHEYNHVLQFGIDYDFDAWIGEATATWMEDQVYPAGDDWLGYLPSWATIPEFPITTYAPDASGAERSKVYGTSVFVHWLAERTALGVAGVRDAWTSMKAASPADYAVSALDSQLTRLGTSTSDEFGRFAATSAEWRAADSGFRDRGRYAAVGITDVARITVPAPTDALTIDHLGYRLFDVPRDRSATTLTVRAPAGVSTSIALVGRTGAPTTGTTTIRRVSLPAGGTGSVDLSGLSGYARVTAVVANTDTRVDAERGRSATTGDWTFRGDGASYALAIGTELPADPGTGTTPIDPAPTSPNPAPAAPATTTPATTTPTGTLATAATATTTAPPTAPAPATTVPPVAAPTASSFVLSKASILSPLGATSRALARALSSHGITKLRRGISGLSFRAPGAGRLTVSVRVGSRTVTSGTRTAAGRMRITTRLRPSAAGRRTLATRSSRRVMLVLRFAPETGVAHTVRRTITVRR